MTPSEERALLGIYPLFDRPVERVADILRERCGIEASTAETAAREILEAMRVPTRKMHDAGIEVYLNFTKAYPVKHIWIAMIDAALAA